MELKVKIFEFSAGRPIAILNSHTAARISVHVGERIIVSKFGDRIIAMADVSKDFLKENEIAVSKEVMEAINVGEGDHVEVSLAERPRSILSIKNKMDNQKLSKEETTQIIQDIVNNALAEAEIAYFVSGVYKSGMSDKEIENLIWAMVSTGKRLTFQGSVVDKHSIGGIAANRTTPIVIPICASLGLKMPKTSSRAITSAAGTADAIESIARVEFSADEIKKIVEKIGACMVWGGSLGLSPADDKLIQVEKILNIDPEPQLLASVLSKKISVGSKYVLIDIPYGEGAKVDKQGGIKLKKRFEYFGKKFGLILKCVLTKGSEPIGNGMGPLLEIRDAIKVLKREKDFPRDLEDKALYLAGEIIELAMKVKNGEGKEIARKALESGEAFKKFKEIIEAQEGKVPTVEEINKRLGKYKKDIIIEKNARIKFIDNKKMNLLARIAGSPMDKGSGIFLQVHTGTKLKKGQKLMTFYSDSQVRLKSALELYEKLKPILY